MIVAPSETPHDPHVLGTPAVRFVSTTKTSSLWHAYAYLHLDGAEQRDVQAKIAHSTWSMFCFDTKLDKVALLCGNWPMERGDLTSKFSTDT